MVVETDLPRQAELLAGFRRSERRPEDAGDDHPETINVVVALDHVVGEIAVEITEREQRVFQHRGGDQPHPGDGVVDR